MCECAREGVRCRATGNAPNYPLFTQLYTHAKIAEVVTVIDTEIQGYRITGIQGYMDYWHCCVKYLERDISSTAHRDR